MNTSITTVPLANSIRRFSLMLPAAIVMAAATAFALRPAFAARGGERGGGAHFSGGGAHVGGGGEHFGGGARSSFGHAPTFSTPHVARAPEFHAAPHETFSRTNVARPNVSRPALENHPEFAQRPAIEGRPDTIGRIGLDNHLQNHYDFFGRPGIADHSALGVRPSYVNHPEYFNRGATGRTGVVAGAGAVGRNPLLGSWYHGDWHGSWGNGRYHWYGRPAWWWGNNWWGAGYLPGYAAWTIPWNWGYWSYYNPYYTAPLTFGSTVVDYAQPIVLATPPAGVNQTTAQDQAMQSFAAARDAFMNGDYRQALTQVDNAIGLLPNDAVLHEFRGLTLFALGDYRQAAASIYAALSVGPGWDWTTLSSFYPDVDVYTQQLRALEQYAGQHPNQPDARFLLAYEYLTCGYVDQAIPQLQDVVQLNPKDQLAAQLLASLTNPQTASPGETSTGYVPLPGGSTGSAAPGEPTPSAVPVSVAALTGRWTATRPDGGTIVLNLGGDSKFDWNYTAGGQSHNFGGGYSIADNLLILKQGDSPAMVGQVTMLNNRQFNFKMPGDNPNDPGLTFTRS
ncbi:MAG TPA: hypothetical protein VHX65_11500 [Pirellulales bacterium]|nr:hypothetical protein [Pirellulales bacterium]